jgi:amino acid adenylation domain-containing protein
MFGMQTMPLPPLEFADMKVSPIELGSTTAKFYLDLMFEDAEDGMHGRIEYNTDLFDDSTIGRMLDHFQNLLESVLAHPERRLSAFSLLSSEERRRMLEAWNDTSAAAPYDQCFQELFEAQVARTPDAVAAVAGDRPMTYRALNARANRLAHHLREAGVGPDTLVALFMERGIDLLTGILAVFKSGGAYVPLDPAHPADRLLHVLDQGGVDRVVSTRELAPALLAALASAPLSRQPEVFQIEELLDRTSPDQNLPVSCRPSNLAYVIYTSGSTGMPKGVMIEQKGLVNHLYMMVRELGLTGADAIAQTASQCFDISVWQFLSILLVGGRVQILPNEIANDPEQLSQQVDAGKISVLQIVPSLLRMMLDDMAGRASPRSSLSSLRWLIPTGEALPPELCQRWFAYYPTIPLLNAYGPAECSDDVTFYPIRAPLGAEVVYTPIGRPAMNMQVYVLDRRMQPAPIGVIGELYVGGVGVGRGYLNAPRRTGEAFVPDPFSQQAGARLYGTGDLARWLPSGDLEFVGRVDHQVKIRGFRIELGEIEVVLGQHPKVRECVVLAREDVPGDQRLVAYAVAREGSSLGVSDLRSYLRDRLPDYMVPSAFITLEAMPLSPNGKIDRSALPAPDGTRLEPDEAFVAPRTPLEETLTEIWAKVLGVARVGIHDNFFTLGGHSLLATQVVSRIREAFSIDLPLRSLFTAPTVAELSNTVVGLKAEGVEGSSLDDMLAQLDGLSEEEVQAMLASGELLTDDEGVS